MLYGEFINKAIDLTITQADNGLYYLEPLWRTILHDANLNCEDISDFKVSPAEVSEVLKLEVKKKNIINSEKPYVLHWLYDLITAQVEPAMLQEETDYIKQVMEYMKANHEGITLKE